MKTVRYLALTIAFVGLSFIGMQTSFAGSDGHGQAVHWGYDGECGADHWGDLKSEYAVCKIGVRQSPVSITLTEKSDLAAIQFHYYATPLKIINNGHTIQVNYGSGSLVTIGNKKYNLLQFHFHNPSEHKINGVSCPMEAHFVHRGEDGKLAVVGVFMKEGKGNAFIDALWDNLPKEECKENAVTNLKINAKDLLPSNATYYNYAGSLTTPPCSEIVNWFVLKTPIEVSKAQLDEFASIFKKSARPVQPLNGRVVKESR